jgi:septal ring factor EnvC (AmiA/AmiB activator)
MFIGTLPVDDEIVVKFYDSPETKRTKNRIEEYKRSIRNTKKDIQVNDEKFDYYKRQVAEYDSKISDLKQILRMKSVTEEEINIDLFAMKDGLELNEL